MLEEHCSEGLALLEKHESTGEVTHGQDGRSETVGPKKKSLHWPPKSWPLFMATAVLVYIAVVLTVIAANLTVSRLQRLRPTYSPVRGVVKQELQRLNFTIHGQKTLYSGYPTTETDDAWHELTSPLMINASYEELDRAGESPEESVRLVGGGYLASTAVYHQLHCLKRIRWYLYRETYYPNITEDEHEYLSGHIDHCIETLRVLAMCQADVTLYSYGWGGSPVHQMRKSNAEQVCVKWDEVATWMQKRSVTWNPLLVAPE